MTDADLILKRLTEVRRFRTFAWFPLPVLGGWVWLQPVWCCWMPLMGVGGLFCPTHWYERCDD